MLCCTHNEHKNYAFSTKAAVAEEDLIDMQKFELFFFQLFDIVKILLWLLFYLANQTAREFGESVLGMPSSSIRGPESCMSIILHMFFYTIG